jgi:hypothetical protein
MVSHKIYCKMHTKEEMQEGAMLEIVNDTFLYQIEN